MATKSPCGFFYKLYKEKPRNFAAVFQWKFMLKNRRFARAFGGKIVRLNRGNRINTLPSKISFNQQLEKANKFAARPLEMKPINP
ncbi:hypothetical protein [Alcaligenes parafaecalis]|uniref:Uncharacterized protein n=1 Tax=Alcaligenes parafaecalis TaxID=171260 RepID=A0ABT3VLC4_9BURK|nr:hypothetical protein [Alcaligenes parafaecalis]MCX5462896.1 hypothetical protein [Alcaligenes parafaecalis]